MRPNRYTGTAILTVMVLFVVLNSGLFAQSSMFNGASIQALRSDFFDDAQSVKQPVLNSPTDVYSADLDGDGDKDVLSASTGSGKIAWYENQGSGSFGTQQIIVVGQEGLTSIYAADLDGDGDQDVLSTSEDDDTIAWYENQGSGEFASQEVISSSVPGPQDVRAADMNGDGNMDIVAATGSRVVIFANQSGSFPTGHYIGPSDEPAVAVYTEDLNGNGNLDVVAAYDSPDKIAWFANQGSGSYSAQKVVNTDLYAPRNVFAADLNGDGNADILSAARSGSDNISWYANNGDGTFGSPQTISSDMYGANGLYAADFEGDGDMDVLATNTFSDEPVRLFKNQGGGSFASQQVVSDSGFSGGDVMATDLSGNGNLDVLTLSANQSKVIWYPNTGSASFDSQQEVAASPTPKPSDVYVHDLNGDGDKDMLTALEATNEIAWFPKEGEGNYGDKKVITTMVDLPISVYAADLDGDGDTDVLSASHSDKKIAWYENQGDGSFGSQQVLTSSADGAWEVKAGDLDNDGDMDVVSVSRYSNQVSWFENQGGGSFGTRQSITSNVDDPREVHLSDIDQDGDLDVVSVSNSDHKVAWYENQGGGSFGSQQVVSSGATYPRTADVADVTGDGEPDIVYIEQQGFHLLENTGFGSFDSEQTLISEQTVNAARVSASDLDNDGDADLVANIGDGITMLENDGNGNFSNTQTINRSVYGITELVTTDLGADKDQDIVVSVSDENRLIWYENRITGISIQASNDQVTLAEDHNITFPLLANDRVPFPQETQIMMMDSTHNGEAMIQDDSLHYEPNQHFNGRDSLSYVAQDTAGSDTAWVHITVEPVPDSPVAVADTIEVERGKKTVFSPLPNDYDPDGDSLAIAWIINAQNGIVDVTLDRHHLIYTPAESYTGTDKFQYAITDFSEALDDEKRVTTVHVEIVEEKEEDLPPVAMLPGEITVPEDSTLHMPLDELAGDDKDTLTDLQYTLSGVGATGASIDASEGTFTLQPDADWWGHNKIYMEVEDSNGQTTTDSTIITVVPVNDPPQAEAGIVNEAQVAGGYKVTFADSSADAKDPEGTITQRQWNFGDGSTSSEAKPSHVYSNKGTYTVQLVVTDNGGAKDTTSMEIDIKTTDLKGTNLPEKFALKGNYPNPFNPATQIQYDVPKQAEVTLEVYNTAGKRVATLVNSSKAPGSYTVSFDAGNLTSGIYIYRMKAGDYAQTRKMTLIK